MPKFNCNNTCNGREPSTTNKPLYWIHIMSFWVMQMKCSVPTSVIISFRETVPTHLSIEQKLWAPLISGHTEISCTPIHFLRMKKFFVLNCTIWLQIEEYVIVLPRTKRYTFEMRLVILGISKLYLTHFEVYTFKVWSELGYTLISGLGKPFKTGLTFEYTL